jgi:hypothetical protein
VAYHFGGTDVRDKIREFSCPEPNTGCWLWERATTRGGYGNVWVNGRIYRAHRASYEAFVGAIAPGLSVCHKCDTPACVNPDHLFLGSNEDNARDKVRKGRQLRGERHHWRCRPESRPSGARHGSKTKPERIARGEANAHARLTVATVRMARQRVQAGESQTRVAADLGVSLTTVNNAVRRTSWRHVN